MMHPSSKLAPVQACQVCNRAHGYVCTSRVDLIPPSLLVQGSLANFQSTQPSVAMSQQPGAGLNALEGRGRLGSGLQQQLAVGTGAAGNQMQVRGVRIRGMAAAGARVKVRFG